MPEYIEVNPLVFLSMNAPGPHLHLNQRLLGHLSGMLRWWQSAIAGVGLVGLLEPNPMRALS